MCVQDESVRCRSRTIEITTSQSSSPKFFTRQALIYNRIATIIAVRAVKAHITARTGGPLSSVRSTSVLGSIMVCFWKSAWDPMAIGIVRQKGWPLLKRPFVGMYPDLKNWPANAHNINSSVVSLQCCLSRMACEIDSRHSLLGRVSSEPTTGPRTGN